MTKISTLSDQPFSFPPQNVIFGVKIIKFLIPGQNFGIFASPTKGMDTFLFEMSMKWMFTFKNFRNVYWHGKTHSALSVQIIRWISCLHVETLFLKTTHQHWEWLQQRSGRFLGNSTPLTFQNHQCCCLMFCPTWICPPSEPSGILLGSKTLSCLVSEYVKACKHYNSPLPYPTPHPFLLYPHLARNFYWTKRFKFCKGGSFHTDEYSEIWVTLVSRGPRQWH